MAFDEVDWASFLSRELGTVVRVRFGRARHRVLEARPVKPSTPGSSGLDVRMSAFFGDAPPAIRDAVARWLRVGRRARRSAEILDRWIADSIVQLPPVPRPTRLLRAVGRHHDLEALASGFAHSRDLLPELESWPGITWGRITGSRPRHSLQLGCYVLEENLVRLHPVLDREWVPEWFVKYVLFHELLHAAVPPSRSGGRTVHHGAEFRRRERQYPDFARALEWQEKNLPRLLRDARAKRTGFDRGHRKPPRPMPTAESRNQPEHAPGSIPRQGLLFSS